MSKNIKNIISGLTYIGIRGDISKEKWREIILLNKLTLLWLPTVTVFSVFFLVFGLYVSGSIMAIMAVFQTSIFYYNKKRSFSKSRFIATVVVPFLVFLLTIFDFPRNNNSKAAFLLINLSFTIYPFLFYSLREKKQLFLSLSLIFIYTFSYDWIKDVFEIENSNPIVNSRIYLGAIYLTGTSMLLSGLISVKALNSLFFNEMKSLFHTTVKQNNYIQSLLEEVQDKNNEAEYHRRELLIQQEEMFSSIKYAEQMQKAMLPSHELFMQKFDGYFIMDKPLSIVSGDFYWIRSIGNRIIITVADCTGHGIPGGFMSMLGLTLLNEIAGQHSDYSSERFLQELKFRVVSALSQGQGEGAVKDGMDLALCIIDKTKMTLQFSGANNPVYYLRGDKLTELKGDRIPVGFTYDSKQFSSTEIQLQKGDKIYLFSDGFADQPGGPRNKKMMYRRFKEQIVASAALPMREQGEYLEGYYTGWLGDNDQIDDVMLLGVTI